MARKLKIIDEFGFFKSLVEHYESEISRAKATIKLYIQEPTGVGEHSEIQLELEKWVCRLATADEAISVLNKYFYESDK